MPTMPTLFHDETSMNEYLVLFYLGLQIDEFSHLDVTYYLYACVLLANFILLAYLLWNSEWYHQNQSMQ